MNLRLYRTGIMAVSIMLVIHFAMPGILRYTEQKSRFTGYFENNFRFGESVDRTALDAFIYHIKSSDGYKIVFIGDSVVAGATVKNNADTIPASFNRYADDVFPDKDINVYNLGIPGNRPSDIRFTLRKLQENHAADFIIMNVNYAFYSDEMFKELPIARPELYDDVMDQGSALRLGLKFNRTEHFLKKAAAASWHLYGLREELAFFLFGMNPREKLPRYQDGHIEIPRPDVKLASPVNPGSNPDRVWSENKPFSSDKIEHWKQVFNIGELDAANTGYYFLKKMVSDISSGKIPTAVFFTPINQGMLKELDLMEHGSKFVKNMKKMESEFSTAGIPVLDYTYSIDTALFNDLFHMIAPGNDRLAKILFHDVEDILAGEVGG